MYAREGRARGQGYSHLICVLLTVIIIEGSIGNGFGVEITVLMLPTMLCTRISWYEKYEVVCASYSCDSK